MNIKKVIIYMSISAFLVMSLLFLISSRFLIIPLGPGYQDFTYDLTGEYKLIRNSAHYIMIVPKDGWGEDTPIIDKKVIELDWNKTHIIAKRQGMKLRNHFEGDTYEIPDENHFDFWILDVTIPQVYGPFTEEEFNSKRTELNVSEKLELQKVDEFR